MSMVLRDGKICSPARESVHMLLRNGKRVDASQNVFDGKEMSLSPRKRNVTFHVVNPGSHLKRSILTETEEGASFPNLRFPEQTHGLKSTDGASKALESSTQKIMEQVQHTKNVRCITRQTRLENTMQVEEFNAVNDSGVIITSTPLMHSSHVEGDLEDSFTFRLENLENSHDSQEGKETDTIFTRIRTAKDYSDRPRPKPAAEWIEEEGDDGGIEQHIFDDLSKSLLYMSDDLSDSEIPAGRDQVVLNHEKWGEFHDWRRQWYLNRWNVGLRTITTRRSWLTVIVHTVITTFIFIQTLIHSKVSKILAFFEYFGSRGVSKRQSIKMISIRKESWLSRFYSSIYKEEKKSQFSCIFCLPLFMCLLAALLALVFFPIVKERDLPFNITNHGLKNAQSIHFKTIGSKMAFWHVFPEGSFKGKDQQSLDNGFPIIFFMRDHSLVDVEPRVESFKILSADGYNVITPVYAVTGKEIIVPLKSINKAGNGSRIYLWGDRIKASFMSDLAKDLCKEGLPPSGVIIRIDVFDKKLPVNSYEVWSCNCSTLQNKDEEPISYKHIKCPISNTDLSQDEFVSGLGLNFSLRDHKAESYMFAEVQKDGYDGLKKAVLNSERVVLAIEQLCSKDGITKNAASQKAEEILNEIAHAFSLRTIRFMAMLLVNIVKRMFKHVFVNRDGISKVSDAVMYAPLVFIPSHNSYFDFLLTSLVCFAHDLPLPAIASGQDFLNIAIVNGLLRGSGAYFLRRSFADDNFYKSIFTEYVQKLIEGGQMPIEFFLEGTRSRSGKALPPKTGMLSMMTEMFFLGHIPDVQFCPISISYECIVEEQLYLFELLGIPKPKESLSGLVKARKVLSTDHGSVYFHLGEIVSLRKYCNPSINRAEYTLFPRHLPKFRELVHSKKEKKIIHRFAKYLVDCQQADMVIYPRSIVAAAILQNISSVEDVTQVLIKVTAILQKLHRSVHEVNNTAMVDVIERAVALSYPVLELASSSQERVINIRPFEVSIDELRNSSVGGRLHRTNQLSTCLSEVYLSLQRNKLMHALLIPSYVAAAVNFKQNESISFRELTNNVSFLFDVFCVEFVRHPDIGISEAIEESIDILTKLMCVHVVGHDANRTVHRLSADNILLTFLQGLIHPFLESYWLLGQCLLSASIPFPCSISNMATQIQSLAASVFTLGILRTHEAISLQTLKNGIECYIKANCLVKSKTTGANKIVTCVDKERLWTFISRLGHLAGLPDVRLRFTGVDQSAQIVSKI
eukprot:gene19889-21831_t